MLSDTGLVDMWGVDATAEGAGAAVLCQLRVARGAAPRMQVGEGTASPTATKPTAFTQISHGWECA